MPIINQGKSLGKFFREVVYAYPGHFLQSQGKAVPAFLCTLFDSIFTVAKTRHRNNAN